MKRHLATWMLAVAALGAAHPARALDPARGDRAPDSDLQSLGVDRLDPRGAASGNGSALDVRPPGSAAGPTLSTLFMSGCMPIELFGGRADGVTDNSPAVEAAVANPGRVAQGATDTGLCLQFGAGTYRFSRPWAFEYPRGKGYPNRPAYAFAVRGAGSGATNLAFASGDGIVLTLHGHKQTAHLDGLRFVSTTPGTGSGLRITQTECLLSFNRSTFRDLVFEGLDPRKASEGGPEHRWGVGAEIVGLSGTSWTGITVFGDDTWTHGTGLSFKGNTSGACKSAPNGYHYWHSIYHDLSHIALLQTNIGLLLDDYVQGVTISGANFQNGNYGIFQPAGMTAPDNVQLNVTNSQFQLAVANVSINTGFSILQFANNTLLMGEKPGVVGLDVKGTNLATITGNMFNTVVPKTGGGIGIAFNGAASAITGNTFSGLTTGVDLKPGSTNTTVLGNTYNVVATPYANAGTANTLPTVTASAARSITTCNAQGFFIPHNLPGKPAREKVQVSLALPAAKSANIAAPTLMVTDTSDKAVTVVFKCEALAVPGTILINVSASLSN